jgi:hypothetical protein
MDALLRRLIRTAMRRGMAGDWVWLALAAATFVLRRVLSDKGGVISSVEVKPGEQVLITVRDRNTPPMAAPVLAPLSQDES